VATAPDDSQNGTERDLFSVAHRVDLHTGKIHDAEMAVDLPRLRRELYALRHLLDEVLA
jgi:hypothetical protein